MAERLLSPRQAVDYILEEWHLKVSTATVRRWVNDGAVPATVVGRRRFIDPAALHAIFDAPKVQSGND
jgi:excisionase family DNA binding protein